MKESKFTVLLLTTEGNASKPEEVEHGQKNTLLFENVQFDLLME